MASSPPPPAAQASKAALSAALADKSDLEAAPGEQSTESQEPGELPEVDMQAQAENIRTVFTDPTNFNVKVRAAFVSYENSC